MSSTVFEQQSKTFVSTLCIALKATEIPNVSRLCPVVLITFRRSSIYMTCAGALFPGRTVCVHLQRGLTERVHFLFQRVLGPDAAAQPHEFIDEAGFKLAGTRRQDLKYHRTKQACPRRLFEGYLTKTHLIMETVFWA